MRKHALLGAGVLAVLVMPLAFAGAASDQEATSSKVTDAKFKKLKQRVAALEGKPTPATPTTLPPNGPAGGNLTGTYPNPLLADDSVRSDTIATEEVNINDLAPNSVVGTKIADNAITDLKISNGAVGALDLDTVVERSDFVTVDNNDSGQVTAGCGVNEQVISGGGQFSGALNEVKAIQSSFMSGNGWTVAGRNFSTGGPRTLTAFAYCLSP